MRFNDLHIPEPQRDKFQQLLDQLYKAYSDEMELMIEEAASEIEDAVLSGALDSKQIVTDWTTTAAQCSDDYYNAVRRAWRKYTGVDMPSMNSYGLIDVNSALWNTQTKLINDRYVGLRYKDLVNGTSRYGIGFNDLWPEFKSGDDAQQFIADMMRNAARLQTQRNITHDPTHPRWARVPQGKTCAFCTMLASRGFEYTSEEAAGVGNDFHDDCDCKIVPSWGKQTLKGYDPDRMRQWWNDAKGAAGEDQSSSSVLRAMRRMDPERYSDGIAPKPDARWSGAPRPQSPAELARLSDFSRRMPWDRYTQTQKEEALTTWTGGAYAGINRYLFDKLSGNEWIDDIVDRIDEAMGDHPTYEAFTVDRQMMLRTFHIDSLNQIGQIKVNDKFDHLGYAACSTIPGGVELEKGRVATRIFVPPGSHGVYIDAISKAKGEKEVLIARGAEFEFIGFDRLDNGDPILCLRLL